MQLSLSFMCNDSYLLIGMLHVIITMSTAHDFSPELQSKWLPHKIYGTGLQQYYCVRPSYHNNYRAIMTSPFNTHFNMQNVAIMHKCMQEDCRCNIYHSFFKHMTKHFTQTNGNNTFFGSKIWLARGETAILHIQCSCPYFVGHIT